MEKRIVLYMGSSVEDYPISQLAKMDVTGLMVEEKHLTKSRSGTLRNLGFEVGIAVGALPGGRVCPASPAARAQLERKLRRAVSFQPDIIWLDHLRFEGHWESKVPYGTSEGLKGAHRPCRYCKRRKRSRIISDLAAFARALVDEKIRLGYYAVPFKEKEHREWIGLLGQDHRALSRVFDFVSPMLYHRMLGKPVRYIGDYVRYLNNLTFEARILPIIQVKDMPDDLPDELSLEDIEEAVQEALTPPSIGVALFTWDDVIQNHKVAGVTEILQRITSPNPKSRSSYQYHRSVRFNVKFLKLPIQH